MTAITRISELFQAVQRPQRRSTIGLWGELLVIAHSSDVNAAVEAWHSTPLDLFDFAGAGQRVEVKTSLGHHRMHYFSFEQANPPGAIRAFVVSVLTTSSVAGVSIAQLVDRITSTIHHIHRTRFQSVAMESLGDGWASGSKAKFDEEYAIANVRWFDIENIPKIYEQPQGVSDTKFKSDLESVAFLSHPQIRSVGGLITSLS